MLDEIQMSRDREQQRRIEARERKLAERKATKNGELEDDDDDDDDDEQSPSEDGDENLAEEDSDADEQEQASPGATPEMHLGTLDELLDEESIKSIVFTLDARDPLAWRCPAVEQLAQSKGKAVLLALTRADLVPLEALASQIHALGASSSSKTAALAPVVVPVACTPSAIAASSGLPATLTKPIRDAKGGVAVVGFENSGRSSLAAALAAELNSESQKEETVSVIDTTHLIAAKEQGSVGQEGSDEEDEELDEAAEGSTAKSRLSQSTIAGLKALLRNKGRVERIKDPVPLVWSLMPLIQHKEDLMLLYSVPAFGSALLSSNPADDEEGLSREEIATLRRYQAQDKGRQDAEQFLIGLARQQGRARKGGLPDVEAAARCLLRDWSSGCIGYYSTPSTWSSLTKPEREAQVAQTAATLNTAGSSRAAGNVTKPRREWKKAFNEGQKARTDLHPSPAIGELRLKSVGETVFGKEEPGRQWALWMPREVLADMAEGDEEDDEDDVDDIEGDSEDDDEDEDEDEDNDAMNINESAFDGLEFDEDAEDTDEELDSDEFGSDEDVEAAPVSRKEQRSRAKVNGAKAKRHSEAVEEEEDESDDDDEDAEAEAEAEALAAEAERIKRSRAMLPKKKKSNLSSGRSNGIGAPQAKSTKHVRVVEPTKAEKKRARK